MHLPFRSRNTHHFRAGHSFFAWHLWYVFPTIMHIFFPPLPLSLIIFTNLLDWHTSRSILFARKRRGTSSIWGAESQVRHIRCSMCSKKFQTIGTCPTITHRDFQILGLFFLFLYNHSNYNMWYLAKNKGAYELPFNVITRGKSG